MGNSSDNPVPLSKESQESDDHQWDGSEAEFVKNGEESDFEESKTGIKLSYKPTYKDFYTSLTRSKMYKRAIIAISLYVLSTICIFISYSSKKSTISFITLILLCLATLANLFNLVYGLKKKSKKLLTDKLLEVEIYPDNILVSEGDKEWKINLDGTLNSEEYKNMILIHLSDEKIFVIPLRCIEPDLVADVQAMIFAGTNPKHGK